MLAALAHIPITFEGFQPSMLTCTPRLDSVATQTSEAQ